MWDAVLWILKLYIPPPLGDDGRMFRFQLAQSIGLVSIWVVAWSAGLWIAGQLPFIPQLAYAQDVRAVSEKVSTFDGKLAPILEGLKEIQIQGLRSNISEQMKYFCNAKRAKNQADLDQANTQLTLLTDKYFALTQRQLRTPSCDTVLVEGN